MTLSTHTLKRRVSAAATVLALGVALPLAIGATPAYAQAELTISKTHTGDFARGGQGTYLITVRNTGDTTTFAETVMTDALPQGLTIATFDGNGAGLACARDATNTVVTCSTDPLPAGAVYTVEIVVDVAEDAPCTVTNTAIIVEQAGAGLSARASDPTPISGGDCGGNDGTGNGSLLPIDLNLSGILPTYNSATNNTFHSQGTTNITGQDAHPNP
ncbi:hypothetical protein OG562_44540 [Streptomyces sp. NBC_01275]|uniref:hypothetical protein n=1 Tax=Streptomyces sp. NBC_01275 TaxID=2903807 RepID=UPI002252ABD6|nr:hypothetical protein [Streptomyces sp. NBC_01275]MCX4767892.1 hypothetical protein [Streptomyces sp. NBC_01275]